MPQYLDADRLEAIETMAFRSASPYPWANPEGLLTEEGYRALLDNMPDISMFERKFGKARRICLRIRKGGHFVAAELGVAFERFERILIVVNDGDFHSLSFSFGLSSSVYSLGTGNSREGQRTPV